MELALIRHTRCDIEPGICYGQLDIPLAATAAGDIAQTLARVPPVDVVYSSPSQRCQTLAATLARRDGCELRTRVELRELNFGTWEGRAWSGIPRAVSDPWAKDPWSLAPPDGESESELWQRVARVVDELRQLEGAALERVAIVSHGGPLRHLRCQLTGGAPTHRWAWSCEWGSVTLIPQSDFTLTVPLGSACPSSDP